MIRIHVLQVRPAVPGMDAYDAECLDVKFEEGCYDHTCLAAAALVRALPSMYRGDNMKVNIYIYVHDELKFGSEGTMAKDDEVIEGAARVLEGGKLSREWW